MYPSEEIRREVAALKAAGKPVVVSMGDLAASGGYWISMNADRIYADPSTITGSIGIFGLIPNVTRTLDKIGAVSYTHLDVYKRQKQLHARRISWLGWQCARSRCLYCLLYTSRCV